MLKSFIRPSSYIIVVPLPDAEMSLLFHGYSGAVDLVTARIADLLTREASRSGSLGKSLSPKILSHLKTRGYLTERTPEAEQAYVVELGRRIHSVLQRHSSPGFLVVPTYACNLRCTYCYERNLQAKGRAWFEKRMSEEMIEAAFEAMERIDCRTHRARALTFYGGEPLQKSNDRIVRLLHEKACTRGFRRFSAITNAVELDHYADLLGPTQGLSFLQITLDGPPQVHDQRRLLPEGGGTFRRIVRNIGLAMQHSTKVSVRINVDRRNAQRVEWLRDFFEDQGWSQNPLFQAYCSPVHGGTCGLPAGDLFTSHLEMQEAIRGRNCVQTKQDEPSVFRTDTFTHAIQKRILAHLSQKQGLPSWRTAFCGANMAMYLFDPFGDVYPCWEVVGHPEHRIGVYGPGVLELDTGELRKWHHRSVVEIGACRSCPYLFFCGGGCEAFAYRATGKFDQPHCFDFPRHFRRAAVFAYQEWNHIEARGEILSGSGRAGGFH